MTVVVAQLSTPEGREALTAATREAVRRATTLVVVVPETDPSPEVEVERSDDLRRVEAEIEGTPARLQVERVSDDLADGLVAAAEAAEADLIVIGLRRRSPVGKLILGTNAQRILLDAPCPVLAVKPERSVG